MYNLRSATQRSRWCPTQAVNTKHAQKKKKKKMQVFGRRGAKISADGNIIILEHNTRATDIYAEDVRAHTRRYIRRCGRLFRVGHARSSRASIPRLPYMASDATTRTPTSTTRIELTKIAEWMYNIIINSIQPSAAEIRFAPSSG